MENHENYTIDEFVLNPSFQAYVLETNAIDKDLWDNYFMRYPEQVDNREKASEIIRLLANAKIEESATKEHDYLRFINSIDRGNRFMEAFKPLLPSGYSNMMKIAVAVVLLITISGFAGFFISNHLINARLVGICKTEVGKGQKSKVMLPDGTEVWLNSESTLTYATDYGKSTRDVKLIGEAYFKVHKDKGHQFIVHITDVELKVFGTEFNVKSYSDENTIETTLVTGSLSIQKNSAKGKTTPLFLKPKQRAVIYKTEQATVLAEEETSPSVDHKVVTHSGAPKAPGIKSENIYLYSEADLTSQIAWKDQKLIFKNETFKSLAHMLERWYDVKIVFESTKVEQYRFRGIFENETIEQALSAMRYTSPFDYTLDHRTIYIKARPEKK